MVREFRLGKVMFGVDSTYEDFLGYTHIKGWVWQVIVWPFFVSCEYGDGNKPL